MSAIYIYICWPRILLLILNKVKYHQNVENQYSFILFKSLLFRSSRKSWTTIQLQLIPICPEWTKTETWALLATFTAGSCSIRYFLWAKANVTDPLKFSLWAMIYNLLSNDWVKFPEQTLRSRFNLIFVIFKKFECHRQYSLGEVHD